MEPRNKDLSWHQVPSDNEVLLYYMPYYYYIHYSVLKVIHTCPLLQLISLTTDVRSPVSHSN